MTVIYQQKNRPHGYLKCLTVHPVTLHSLLNISEIVRLHMLFIFWNALCAMLFMLGVLNEGPQDLLAEHRSAQIIGICDYAMTRHFREAYNEYGILFTVTGIHLHKRLISKNPKPKRKLLDLSTRCYSIPRIDSIEMVVKGVCLWT